MPRSGITSYTRVIDLEQHQESEMEENDVNKSWIQPPTRDFPQRPPSHSFGRHMIFICCVAAAFLLGGFGGGVFLTTRWSASSESKGTPMTFTACKKPAVRREWRSLSRSEKLEYIQAVQCLRSKPSRLGLGHTLYDDFPYVHIHIGNDSHYTAAFLAWHRYFIHNYEGALRKDCGYTGHVAYWDWSLDWEDITQAPVWDAELGFGGNGNKSDDSKSIHGYCVTSGPFANLEVPYVEKYSYPHCLSRDFAHGEDLTRFSRATSPSSIETLLQVEDYMAFVLGVEDGPHLSIPRAVHGDFSTITAPADPVFFLHHAQLDRLWWRWQQVYPQRRLMEYSWKATYTKNLHAADLDDPIRVGGLAPDVLVRDIMNTESEVLCYRY